MDGGAIVLAGTRAEMEYGAVRRRLTEWGSVRRFLTWLENSGPAAKLVFMTRSAKTVPPGPRGPAGRWRLQDAKARFSELVRLVRSEGPQHVTVRGHDEVVVVSAEAFRRLQGDRTGADLIEALQTSPHRDVDIEPRRAAMPVREVDL
jgi:prevent-host-death family protein